MNQWKQRSARPRDAGPRPAASRLVSTPGVVKARPQGVEMSLDAADTSVCATKNGILDAVRYGSFAAIRAASHDR